jgi:hypothetical protein
MLLLFPVLIIQMSASLTNFSWNSSLLTELSEKTCHNIKRETLSLMPKSAKDYVIDREDLKCENNPIIRKESPLKCEIHPKVILKKCEPVPAKKDSTDNQQTVKRVSVITNVLFNGTGNAQLF